MINDVLRHSHRSPAVTLKRHEFSAYHLLCDTLRHYNFACALAVHLILPHGFKFSCLTRMWSFLRPSRVTSRSETRPTGHPQYARVTARIWMKYCRAPPVFPLVNWIKSHIPIVWTSKEPKDIAWRHLYLDVIISNVILFKVLKLEAELGTYHIIWQTGRHKLTILCSSKSCQHRGKGSSDCIALY